MASTSPLLDERVISSGLLVITAAALIQADSLSTQDLEYATTFENDVFALHPYCWCERGDCAWCAVCACADTAWKYYVDGDEVSYETYDECFSGNIGPVPDDPDDPLWPVYERRAAELNARRSTVHTPSCTWCTNPESRRANFEHKPSGTRITWYKYIGRSMQCTVRGSWLQVVGDCLTSLAMSPAPGN